MGEVNYPFLVGWYEGSIKLAILHIQRGIPEAAAEHLQWSLDNAETKMNESAPEVSHARNDKTE